MELWHEEAGDGPPVLLLHEGITDSGCWDPQWRTFPARHRTIRCDLRGYGRTLLPPEPFSHARDVLDLLERLDPGPLSVVGASMGGRVALELAVARPDLVRRLVLVAPADPDHEWSAEAEAYDAAETAAAEARDADAFAEVNLAFWVDGPDRRPEDVDPAVRQHVGAMLRRSLELQIDTYDDAEESLLVPDVSTRCAELAIPVLVVVGTRDQPDKQVVGRRYAERIPGARWAVLEGAAHVPMLERPAEFDRLVLGFLAEADGRPRA
jgi:pimeloyl-ACP methyl ester carboxylesterase